MSTNDTLREQEQVIGTLTGIVQKGPDKWQAVVVPDGSQYGKNLWTKDAPLVGTLSGMIGQRLAFLCNASHWTRDDGQPVRSLWVDQVGPPAVGSPALAGPPQPWDQAQAAQQQASNLPPQQMTAGQQVVVQPQVQPMGVTAPAVVSPDRKEQRIHRQTASKVAAIMLTHVAPEERTMTTLLILADRLVAYYNDGLPMPTLDELIVQAEPDDIPF